MAATEGQLDVEFVQALTAEARAHREYLQLLYTLAASLFGAAAILAGAIIALLGRYDVKKLRDELRAVYERQAIEASETGRQLISDEVEAIRERLSKHEQMAQEQLNNIAMLAADAKGSSLPPADDSADKGIARVDYFPNYINVGKEVIRVVVGMGFTVSGNMDFNEAIKNPRRGNYALIDLDETPISEAIVLHKKSVQSYGARSTIVYVSDQEIEKEAEQILPLVVGPAALVSRLRRMSRLERPKADRH